MEEVKTVVTERVGMEAEAAKASQGSDVTVVTMPAWQIVGVRALRVYLQSLVGFLLAGGIGLSEAVTGTPAGTFAHQLVIAASLSVAPATMSLLQNVVELLAKIDATNPTFRA